MDVSSLQTPKSGRSRFSKALPTPPPGLANPSSRGLPNLPPAPVPPRKNTVLVKSKSTVSLGAKSVNSPLPALPPPIHALPPPPPSAMAGPQLQIQTRMIPRKPVGQSATTPSATSTKATKKLRRVSSISSILSAYSHSSNDSAQRSSHESDFTKDSEPSYSPEREDLQPKPTSQPVVFKNPQFQSDNGSVITENTIVDSFPPPPSVKDTSYRPRTPNSGFLPSTLQDKAQDGLNSSPISITNASPGGEIWRRRANSKSDGSINIANLKLPGSNGSTATATQASSGVINNTESAAPPPPLKIINSQSPAPLPPRNASLPGRNIKPLPQPAPIKKDEGMKFKVPAKLKELMRSGGEDEKGASNRADNVTAQSSYNNKPAPPVKELPAIKEPWPAQSGQNTRGAQQPVSPPKVTAPPPQESVQPTVIVRRPVGSPKSPLTEPDSEPENKMPTPGHNLATPPSLGPARPPQTPGTLPHPRQKLSPNPSPKPSTTPSPGRPQELDTSSLPVIDQRNSTNETMQATISGPLDIPQVPYENTQSGPQGPFVPPPSLVSGAAKFDKSSFGNTQPHTLSDVQENSPSNWHPNASPAMRSNPIDIPYNDSEDDIPPMSDDAARAIALFPRNQTWDMQPSPNGVWSSVPLGERHFNCHGNHSRFVPARNSYYALTCQTCGVPDAAPRKSCASCNLRICIPCHELLMANSRDLRSIVVLLQGGHGQEKDNA
ncbi:hypothetical protein F5Y16DRAFT_375001 [Xylariaceae sp. FL0255]|nr:hypothetical protein F5Y16DRAFT_375001 [Xylariaceae sp. FL0255]